MKHDTQSIVGLALLLAIVNAPVRAADRIPEQHAVPDFDLYGTRYGRDGAGPAEANPGANGDRLTAPAPVLVSPLPPREKATAPPDPVESDGVAILHTRDDLPEGETLRTTTTQVVGGTGWTGPAAEADVKLALRENRITLSLDEVPLLKVLKLISQTSRINIIAGPDVSGMVSVNLYDVPLGEALNSILGIGGYAYYAKENIIYVASEKRKLELPATAHDMAIRAFTLNHTKPDQVLASIAPFLSPSGKVVISPARQLIVRDAPNYMHEIERLIAEIDTPPLQVLITARILTVQHDDDLTLGVEFNRAGTLEDGGIIFTRGFAADPRDLPPGATGLFAGKTWNDYTVFLEMLQEKGDVDILASPQLLVLNGESAEIQVGDRLGFRLTTVTETARLESIEFLEVGTVLEVRPNIGNDGLIRLNLHPKVSNGRISAEGLPSESTTEAETQMIVADRESVVIGGLINLTKRRIRSQVPLLGDIPYVGYLFGRNRMIDNKQELIIIITPEIVGPSPTAGMRDRIATTDEREDFLLKNQSVLEWPKSFQRRANRRPGAPRE